MADAVLLMIVRTRPGQRDALRALWETYLKPRAAAEPAQPVYYYCTSREHPDEILMFEHYTDETVLQANAISEVFATFMDAARPLIEGEPVVKMGDPVWIKR